MQISLHLFGRIRSCEIFAFVSARPSTVEWLRLSSPLSSAHCLKCHICPQTQLPSVCLHLCTWKRPWMRLRHSSGTFAMGLAMTSRCQKVPSTLAVHAWRHWPHLLDNIQEIDRPSWSRRNLSGYGVEIAWR